MPGRRTGSRIIDYFCGAALIDPVYGFFNAALLF